MKYAFQSINAHKDEIINIESELGVQENRILNLQNSLKCKYYLILDILVTVTTTICNGEYTPTVDSYF
jgi:hypothetical protein